RRHHLQRDEFTERVTLLLQDVCEHESGPVVVGIRVHLSQQALAGPDLLGWSQCSEHGVELAERISRALIERGTPRQLTRQPRDELWDLRSDSLAERTGLALETLQMLRRSRICVRHD